MRWTQRDIDVKRGLKPKTDKIKCNEAREFESLVLLFCKINTLEVRKEYRFHPVRRWRFDFEINSLMVGLEYNGIMSSKSRHTSITGYSGDMEKINAAQLFGYKVLQYTPLNYKSVWTDLEMLLKGKFLP